MEETKIRNISPTPELLQEMEALEIRGGANNAIGDIYTLASCTIHIYSGNCVPGCACNPKEKEPLS